MSRNEKVAAAHRFRTITSTPKHSLTSPSPLDIAVAIDMAVAIGSAITFTLAPGHLFGHDHAVSNDVCRDALTPPQRERFKHKKKREQAQGC
jgi:hypothetical protein